GDAADERDRGEDRGQAIHDPLLYCGGDSVTRAVPNVCVRPASSTAVKVSCADPLGSPRRAVQKALHASLCAATRSQPGPHALNDCANCAAEYVLCDCRLPERP